MNNMLMKIYALLVCFVAVVCITITTGMGLYDLVKIVNPRLTLSPHQYQHLQSNEGYRRAQYGGIRMINPYGSHGPTPPELTKKQQWSKSDAEIEAIREAELDLLAANERRIATSSLIRLLIVLLVTCPLFYIHWRIAGRHSAP
jgi:hypothetical protein